MASKRQIQDILAEAVESLKKAGADHAKAIYTENAGISLGLREGKLDEYEVATKPESHITLIARVGDKMGYVNPDTKRLEFLKKAAPDAVAVANAKTANPDQQLPDPDLLTQIRTNRSLELYDPTKPSIKDLEAKMIAAENAAKAVPHFKLVDSTSASWGHERTFTLTSTGEAFENEESYSAFSISVIAQNGKPMNTASDYTYARYWSDLRDPAAVGRKAAEKAAAGLNPKKAPTGQFPVIFSPDMAASLLGHFAAAASGDRIFLGQSFLSVENLDKQIMAPGIIILDNPHKIRGFASTMYTGSGLPTRPVLAVEKGVLKSLFHSLESVRRLKFPLTAITGGNSNMTIEPGTLSKQALLDDVREGFYVTSLLGQGVNIANGNYSRGASGFWIKNGVLTHAVAEATIAGNLRDMFMNMTAANDLNSSEKKIAAPTLRVDGMSIG